MTDKTDKKLMAFLLWMAKNNIDSVIQFFVIQDGRNPKIPHWTDGKRLYDADELIKKFLNQQPK